MPRTEASLSNKEFSDSALKMLDKEAHRFTNTKGPGLHVADLFHAVVVEEEVDTCHVIELEVIPH